MKHFVFELKFCWRGIYGNLLEWIPCINIFIKTSSPSISLKWMGMEMSLWIGFLKTPGKCIYITPCFVFKHLNEKFKEKYDFQFSWLGINYRKFIGEKENYKISIIEQLKNPFNFEDGLIDILSFKDYDQFLAECYEAEDEFWKGIYEDIEADRVISE